MTTEPNPAEGDGWPRQRARLILVIRFCLWLAITGESVAIAAALASGDPGNALLPTIAGIAVVVALILSHGLRPRPAGEEPATTPTEQEGAPQ